jgi:hypothetical protein
VFQKNIKMNKYITTLVFYLVEFIVFYVVNKYSISPQDGGLSMGSIVIMVGMLAILVLLGINVYKGFSVNKEYFILAGIHLLVFVGLVYKLFL